ncbi:MAG TPA: DUF5666 domain-containing protein [Anaerolineales bacterium]|nr:DUF5666 domain-containing protein [Anaerolineales bacterium]
MQDLDSLLQDKIDLLEVGESLDTCLMDLPEQEANLLKLVATIRKVDFSAPEGSEFTEQRSQVLNYAQQTLKGKQISNGGRDTAFPNLLDQVRSILDRLLSRRELAFGAVALLVMFACVFLFLATAGLMGWMINQDNQVAEVPGISTAEFESIDKQPIVITPLTTEQIAATEAVAQATPAGSPTDVAVEYVPVTRATPALPEIDPKTAAVQVMQGSAQIQTGDEGEWVTVNQVGTLVAGQRIRTGKFSKVILTFYDGSEVHLGANTVIFVDELDAQPTGKAPRIVKLTQRLGETEHIVTSRDEKGARYKITTPGGIGTVQGTKFSVLVTEDLLTRFAVTEGELEVNNLNKAVVVKPGQSTITIAGQKPSEAVFQINGEGEVSQIGLAWIISGQSFQITKHTNIVGDPQVGDLVRVEGYTTFDGKNVAVRILLLQHALTNQFTLTGEVEEIGGGLWKVSGQELVVNDETSIEGDIEIGDTVYVSGVILTGGTLLAERIILVDETPGLAFFFVGLVQEIYDNYWVISDRVISIDGNSTITPGIAVGDLVVVRGRILEDDIWLARSITLSSNEATFEFTGIVQTIDPWTVSGISFEMRDWTIVEPGIEAGDLVRVNGTILSDGTWVATRISSLENLPLHVIVFVGIVNSTAPWVVNGLPLVISDDTIITGEITVGTPVIVTIQLMEDGTWVVLSIRPIHPLFGFGCLSVNAPVTGITGNQIILGNWAPITLDDDVDVDGEIKVNSVILFHVCGLHDGTVVIIQIIVIYQPVIIIVPPPPKGNGNHNG